MSKVNPFVDFKESKAAEWKEIIEKGLKGKDFNSLITDTPEGIPILPFYTPEEQSEPLISNPFQSENPGLSPRYWINQFKIIVTDEKAANSEALEALNKGADGIIFNIDKKTPDLNLLLENIQPEFCAISFESTKAQFNLIKDYFHFLKTKKHNAQNINGAYFYDILVSRDIGVDTDIEKSYKELASVISLNKEFPHFKSFHIDACLYHNAGANIVHELSFTLSKFTEYLDVLTELQLDTSSIFNATSFSFAFGRHYFFEIAKIKAFKLSVLKIMSAYEHEGSANEIIIHAQTSKRSKSVLDFNVNLLRNSTEAMSAILAGCNSLWVEPHDASLGKSKETFKRIALNVSSILKEEAYLDKIVDPTSGTYYLDNILNTLEQKAWTQFLELENKGSYSALFKDGYVKEKINADEQAMAKAVAERKEIFIGANTFQLIGEEYPVMEQEADPNKYLQPIRATHYIEKLRARTEKHVKEKGQSGRPMATIILLNTDPVAKAKSDFSYSFLGIAGIGIQDETILKSEDDLKENLQNCSSDLVVVCYKDRPENLAESIANCSAKVLIAGMESDEEQLKAKGIYGCIHRKSPTLEFLNQLLTDLGIK
ncbi:methylmalonyl-CoA mutase [Marivirga lumbricoides]|uniref:Methylmalonyl-CoA mutase n=1 Tax=Marivirga lumbricoides TaxID=1046115 RepID=A0ABQ1LYE9_9BACT|nr:methylmalonyl-CoA mutase [Marivirga lumbricoides]